MTEYKVVPDGVPAFAAEITCSDGARSLPGFPTEAAAMVAPSRWSAWPAAI